MGNSIHLSDGKHLLCKEPGKIDWEGVNWKTLEYRVFGSAQRGDYCSMCGKAVKARKYELMSQEEGGE